MTSCWSRSAERRYTMSWYSELVLGSPNKEPDTERPWILVWRLSSLCATSHLEPSTRPWRLVVGYHTTHGHWEKSAKLSLTSTWTRRWPAPQPLKAGVYYYYKGFYSIINMALVGPDYTFLWVDEGSPGASSDAQIYNKSELLFLMTTKTRLAYGSIRWSHTPWVVLQMEREPSITDCSEPGGLLKMPLAFWQTASRFCLPQCSITHPPSRSSWRHALFSTTWWGWGIQHCRTSR